MQFINLIFLSLHLLEQKKDTILAGQFFTRASKCLTTMVTCPPPGLYHTGHFSPLFSHSAKQSVLFLLVVCFNDTILVSVLKSFPAIKTLTGAHATSFECINT